MPTFTWRKWKRSRYDYHSAAAEDREAARHSNLCRARKTRARKPAAQRNKSPSEGAIKNSISVQMLQDDVPVKMGALSRGGIMLPSELEKALQLMAAPIEEVDKTSKLVMSLSAGSLVLIIGFLKDSTVSPLTKLLLGLSALLFVLSLVRWMNLARLSVDFREAFSQALVADFRKSVVTVSQTNQRFELSNRWLEEHALPLINNRHELGKKFVEQCRYFVYGMLTGSVGYFVALLFPTVRSVLTLPGK